MNSKLLKIARYLGKNGFYEEATNLKKLALDMEDQGEETIPDFDKYDQDFAFLPQQQDKLPEVERVDGHGNIDFKVYRKGLGGIPLFRRSDGSIGYSSFEGGEPMMQKYRFGVHRNPRLVSVYELYPSSAGREEDPTKNHIGDVSKIDAIRIWNFAGWKDEGQGWGALVGRKF